MRQLLNIYPVSPLCVMKVFNITQASHQELESLLEAGINVTSIKDGDTLIINGECWVVNEIALMNNKYYSLTLQMLCNMIER